MSTEDSVDGWPPEVLPACPTSASTTSVTTTIPATQPSRKPVLVAVAFRESSMRITAMIGIGLIATPTANKRTRPIAAPTGAAS